MPTFVMEREVLEAGKLTDAQWSMRSLNLIVASLSVVTTVVGWTLMQGRALNAQIPAVNPQVQHKTGQSVAPVYEGWYRTADGIIHVSFGYFNRNLEETPDVPIGPDNRIEPGPADQGQPTHFLPRRQHGAFTVPLPKDAPKAEITWTLTVHGQTVSIPANLDPVYVIEPLKQVGGSDEGNTPPILKFDSAGMGAAGPAGITTMLRTSVADPVTLTVWVTDDGLPKTPEGRGPAQQNLTGGGPSPAVRSGLTARWSKYRGPGTVTFSSPNPPIEQGKAATSVTFSEPGEYVLRVLASDGSSFGGQCCWTNGYVKVSVK
jgi:hypothetical protein